MEAQIKSNYRASYFILISLIIIAVAYGSFTILRKPAEIGQVIGSQMIFTENGAYVKYAYVGGEMDNRMPQNVKKVSQNHEVIPIQEDVEARTSNSRTFITNKEGTKITEFVPGNQYFKDDKSKWWQAEYATTTPEEFSRLPKTPYYVRLTNSSKFAFIKRTFATTDTFYPQTGSGGANTTMDGNEYNSNSNVWSTTRAGNAGFAADLSATPMWVISDRPGNDFVLYRAYFTFDTSSIPDGDDISSATFSIMPDGGGSNTEPTNKADPVLVNNNQTANNTLNGATDYDLLGTTDLDSSAPTIDNMLASAGSYVDFVMNATGIAQISKSGVTKLGLRPGSDFSDSTPPTEGFSSRATFYSADQTGTTQDPKLVVIHSTPPVPSSGAIFNKEIIFGRDVIFQ